MTFDLIVTVQIWWLLEDGSYTLLEEQWMYTVANRAQANERLALVRSLLGPQDRLVSSWMRRSTCNI